MVGKWATFETVLVLSVLFFHWLNSHFLTLDWVAKVWGCLDGSQLLPAQWLALSDVSAALICVACSVLDM